VIEKASNEIIRKMGNRERRSLALKGFFVIRTDRSGVYCPSGEILRRKSVKNDGRIRYCTKSACYDCLYPCFEKTETRRWKEIDFSSALEAKGDRAKMARVLEEFEKTE
jgi:hypothetical protein